jgi:hypothetical protein
MCGGRSVSDVWWTQCAKVLRVHVHVDAFASE